ncbi:MAG TPA: alpha/beta hydrolase [Microbacterium sp.]|nr:alpha/beta hydrolase [Microbacterium sp.]
MTETVLLIPGLLSDGVVWEHQARALSARCDVRMADVTRDASLDGMAQRVLDEVPGQLSVAGHSMGGRVALEMVRIAPERIDRLALLDTGVGPRNETEHVSRLALVELGESEGMRTVAAEWLPPMVRHWDAEGSAELRATLTAMVERMNPTIHRAQIQALLDRTDAEPMLAAITCPVLVAVGDSDAWSPPRQHREMAARIPGAQLVIFPDSGHFSPIEAPEAVTAALVEWMTRTPQG